MLSMARDGSIVTGVGYPSCASVKAHSRTPVLQDALPVLGFLPQNSCQLSLGDTLSAWVSVEGPGPAGSQYQIPRKACRLTHNSGRLKAIYMGQQARFTGFLGAIFDIPKNH